MTIIFQKHAGKHPTTRCIRDDGSETYTSSPSQGEFFVRHDLLHYAVETALGCKSAFWGLLAGGRDFDDFGTSSPSSDPIPEEAIRVEEIVGLIQLGQKPKDLSQGEYEAIVNTWMELLAQWSELADGDSLTVHFP